MLTPSDIPPLFDAWVVQVSVAFNATRFTNATPFEAGVLLPDPIASAAQKRKAEFVAGRFCARRAANLLVSGFRGDLSPSPDGPPRWSDGIVGSITHTDGFASAALARAVDARGVGIDSEVVVAESRVEALLQRVARAERDEVRPTWLSPPAYCTVLFSAKESIFKCLHPLLGRAPLFSEVRLRLTEREPPAFRATLLVDLDEEFRAGRALSGRYRLAGRYVHTGIVLTAR